VDQAELPIDEVKVQMQTLALGRNQEQMLLLAVLLEGIGLARLDAGEHADQALSEAVPLHDVARRIFFREGSRLEIDERAPLLLGQLLGMLLEAIGHPLHKAGKLPIRNVMGSQQPLHPVQVADRSQRAAKQNAVTARQDTKNPSAMPLEKCVHDHCPKMSLKNYHLAA